MFRTDYLYKVKTTIDSIRNILNKSYNSTEYFGRPFQ